MTSRMDVDPYRPPAAGSAAAPTPAWRKGLRWIVAIVATVFVLVFGDTLIAEWLDARGLFDEIGPNTPFGIALNAALALAAFSVGGSIARTRFVHGALVVATLLALQRLTYWADWYGRSLPEEIADSGVRELVCFGMALLGASLGMRARRALDAAITRRRTPT